MKNIFFQKILFPTIVVCMMMNIHHDVDGDEKNVSLSKINCDSLSDKGRFFPAPFTPRRRSDDDSKNRFFICDCHKKEEKNDDDEKSELV